MDASEPVLESADKLPRGALLAPVLLVVLYLVIRVPLRRYQARGYQLGADRLRVVRGLLFRSDTVVPFGRVQHIDVHQGPLERVYGLATLVLHTAGTHNASVSLPGLGHGDAMAMREEIRAHVKHETM
jgi:membrane protein YdbS with pleckstrin-like domain